MDTPTIITVAAAADAYCVDRRNLEARQYGKLFGLWCVVVGIRAQGAAAAAAGGGGDYDW